MSYVRRRGVYDLCVRHDRLIMPILGEELLSLGVRTFRCSAADMGAIVLLTEVLLLVAAPILIVATEAELAEPAQPALFQLDSEGESVITFGPKDKNATVVLSSVFGSNKLDVSGSLDAQDLRVNGTSVAELMAALEAKIIAALPAPSSPSPELVRLATDPRSFDPQSFAALMLCGVLRP